MDLSPNELNFIIFLNILERCFIELYFLKKFEKILFLNQQNDL